MAKGTFYLYFKDKYDIRNKLIAHKSSEVFKRADLALKATGITEIEDRVVFLVDNIISQLVEDRTLLGFISKNLGWGVFKNVLIEAGEDSDVDFYDIYNSMFRDEGKFDNPEVMVFMIIELVGSACHSTILHGEPVGIEEIRPYILRTVRGIMEMHRLGARQDLILNLQKSIK